MRTLEELDHELAAKFGAYASYTNDQEPILIETYADGPAQEVDRLLDLYARPDSLLLDLGCGAGFTLCRLAPKVEHIWGFEQQEDLLEAARLRAASVNIRNATFVHGNAAVLADADSLPDNAFDLVLSRRGPNVNSFLCKMKPSALVIQELFQGYLGLLEMFGRKTFLGDLGHNQRWLIEEYSWLDLFPVSAKDYYVDLFFRDIDHLAAYLSQPGGLYSYPMPPMPYDAQRDRAALELYVKYNTTPQGVRVIQYRSVYLFRRTRVQYAPAVPDAQPSW